MVTVEVATEGLESLQRLRGALDAALALPASSLERAAQNVATTLYEDFIESVVLARVFVTVAGEAPTLRVIGTCGLRVDWRDRRLSNELAGIPLAPPASIDATLVTVRLLGDLGIDVEAFDQEERRTLVEPGLFMSGAFYVEDAAAVAGRSNRKVIPAQDLVAAHRVRTVFGGTAAYPGSGAWLTLLVLASEKLPATLRQHALIAINDLRARTQHFITSGRIFS